jgi:hypothetical protein
MWELNFCTPLCNRCDPMLNFRILAIYYRISFLWEVFHKTRIHISAWQCLHGGWNRFWRKRSNLERVMMCILAACKLYVSGLSKYMLQYCRCVCIFDCHPHCVGKVIVIHAMLLFYLNVIANFVATCIAVCLYSHILLLFLTLCKDDRLHASRRCLPHG